MRNLKILLIACGLLSFLSSCVKDPERHQLIPIESPFILYADQTSDSLRFYTFDSWSVTPEADWITIEGDSHAKINYDYNKRYLCNVLVSFKPNTTGRTRYSSVLVESYDYSYSAPFVQLGMLDVTRPVYTADTWVDEPSKIPDVAYFILTDSANWTSDSICFNVRNKWRLEFADGNEPDWLSLEKTADLPGKHNVKLTLSENTDTENGREAKLRLTSGAVSNIITIRQLPAKEE